MTTSHGRRVLLAGVGGVGAFVLVAVVGALGLALHVGARDPGSGPAPVDVRAADARSAAARTGPGAPAPRLVLVSGRDDHGMVAAERVSLHDAPEGRRVTGWVPDGTLAEVLAVDGQWLEVRTVEGRAAAGWVDDFHLRGQARLVGPAPSCRTTVDGRTRAGGTLVVVRELRRGRVRVESLTPPLTSGWAPRADLQELPPQGTRCGDVPPDDRHAHQH